MTMLLIGQKQFGWWTNLNRKAAIHNAKLGVQWNPAHSKYISKEEYDSYNPNFVKKVSKQELERSEIDHLMNIFPNLKNDIMRLQRLEKDELIKKYHPNFGDGDEYPTFYIDYNAIKKADSNFIPIVIWHSQYERIGINPNKGYWVKEDHPENKINLKQYLLKEYKDQLEDYVDASKKNSYGWNEEDYNEVVEWIRLLIKKVQQYL